MKKQTLRLTKLFLAAVMFCYGGCASNSEDDSEDNPVPGAGGALTIAKVKCCALNLSWTAAADHSDSPALLKYKLVRSLANNINSVYNAEVNGIVLKDWFSVSSGSIVEDVAALKPETDYYFNVIVKDTENNKTVYQTASTSTAFTWKEVTGDAPWSGRSLHGVASFNNKIWVIGGYANDTYKNDVWHSVDGANWVEATGDAPWGPRSRHGVASFNNKIWVIGGYANDTYKNDVWHSSDGAAWSEVTADMPWSVRADHGVAVFNNKIRILGGRRYSYYLNDVWDSTDGARWTSASANAPWSIRYEHSALAFADKLWVIGGKGEQSTANPSLYGNEDDRSPLTDGWYGAPNNDVWHSVDGAIWTRSADAPWSARSAHGALVFRDQLWVLGGKDNKNDVWHSEDGTTWKKASPPPWSGRSAHGALVLDNKIWIVGGYDSNYRRDVWMAE